MTMQITMTQTRMGESGSLLVSGSTYTVSDAFGAAMVGARYAIDTNGALTPAPSALSVSEVAAARALVSGAGISVASSREITSADSGALLRPNAGVTLTIPAGLSPMPSFTVDCPASGTISVAVSGGATMNGASTTLTRTRAANPVGFVVLAHESDAYGVSGG